MLTYAFDLLYVIYEEEGYTPSEIPGLILTKNLYGTEIDPRAAALAGFALCMKARARQRTFFNKRLFPNVSALEAHRFTPQDLDSVTTPSGDRAEESAFWNQFEFADVRGSLIEPNASLHSELRRYVDTRLKEDGDGDLFTTAILEDANRILVQSEYLCRTYGVVIANPPYMGRGAMSDELAGFADIAFPASKSDLFAMFIERCRRLTAPLGITAMVTMQSWMFLPSLLALRRQVLEQGELASLAHIGAKGFDSIGGEVVQTCAFILWNRKPSSAKCVWLRLVDGANEEAKSDILLSGQARYELSQGELLKLPNAAMSYWLSADVRAAYGSGRQVGDLVVSDGQTKTGDNDRFLRFWWEVSRADLGWGNRWVLHPKGGGNRRWFGNVYSVIDWGEAAREHYRRDRVARILPEYLWNRPGISWSNISTSSSLGFRILSPGEIFNLKAPTVFPHDAGRLNELLGFLNSPVASYIVSALNPTISFNVNDVTGLPWKDSTSEDAERITAEVAELIASATGDWNSFEETIGFANDRLIASAHPESDRDLRQLAAEWRAERELERERMHSIEMDVFKHFISLFDLDEELSAEVDVERDTLVLLSDHELAKALASYAVGCMFGRFSLDEPGLILANQSETIDNHLAKVPSPRFAPDPDNVIPVVEGDWFEDDIVTRFRQFLRVAFGEKHFEENLRFVTESLGVKDLRDYFVKSFYADHIQRYKKRPIYWLFSSPKGSFNALIYMHRYTPSTVSTVLNEYLREFKAKLEAARGQQERLAAGGGTPRQQAAAQKEADRIRKMLLELDEYEHDVLYPLASQQIEIDLNDGVKVNYPKFGAALKKIPGLEAAE